MKNLKLNPKKLTLIFVFAFALNFIWENLHSLLYVNYQGGSISEFILLRATLVDALIISLIIYFVCRFSRPKYQSILIFGGGIIIAILIEKWALGTSRWIYSPAMPIIPLIKTGLTPTIQLGLTGLLVFKFQSNSQAVD